MIEHIMHLSGLGRLHRFSASVLQHRVNKNGIPFRDRKRITNFWKYHEKIKEYFNKLAVKNLCSFQQVDFFASKYRNLQNLNLSYSNFSCRHSPYINKKFPPKKSSKKFPPKQFPQKNPPKKFKKEFFKKSKTFPYNFRKKS